MPKKRTPHETAPSCTAFARSSFLDKTSKKGKTQLAHARAPLHLFDEFLRFFEPNAGCLPVKLYRLNFSIGTQRLHDIVGHVSKGIEFDIGLLEQEIQLRFNPGHCRDATLKAVEPNPNCEK